MRRKEHIIEFNKLKNGANELFFSINDKFLETFVDHTDFGNVEIGADTQIFKSDNMYTVDVSLKGKVTLTCDLCLDEFECPVNGTFTLIIKVSEVERYDDDEIVYITPNTIDFDLSQFLFDSFMLSIPLKKSCSLANKTCNAEVMQKLNQMSKEINEEDETPSDPRWDKLKGMIQPE